MIETSVKNFIDNALEQDADSGKTSVIALRPGMGKSTYISGRIKDAALNQKGLIVVTNLISNLTELADKAKDNITDDDFIDEIDRTLWNAFHSDDILVLTADNYHRDIFKASRRPVICMTTQRFFSMSPAEINDIIDNSNFQITDILLDEQPYIMEPVYIKHKDLCDIEVCLAEVLTNLDPEKEQVVQAFSRIKAAILKAFDTTEKKNVSDNGSNYLAYYPDLRKEVSSLQYFMKLHSHELSAELIEQINNVMVMADDGYSVTSIKISKEFDKHRYGKFATVIKDYGDWYHKINAKITVFDGTGNIDPAYGEEFFNVIDCSELFPKIPQLTINLYNCKSSLSSMADPSGRRKLVMFAQALKPEAIFTYKDYEDAFKNCTDRIDHFGAIRGSNAYNNCSHIMQIGVNRLPDYIYEFYSDSQMLRNMGSRKGIRYVGKNKTISFRNKSILADIIQNVFRSKIRNLNNQDEVVYDLLINFSADGYDQLINMIEAYFQPYDVTINKYDQPDDMVFSKILSRKSDDETVSQKITKWLEYQRTNNAGREVTNKVIYEEIGITKEEFDHALAHNKPLKDIFTSMRIKRGLYRIQ